MAATKTPRVFILLILFIITPFMLFVPGECRAEDYGVAQFYTHAFNNNTVVYTGVFALNKDLNLRTSLYAKYTVDFINPSFGEFGEGGGEKSVGGTTSASPHAVSSASAANSSGTNSDTRSELTMGVTHDFGNIAGVELYYDFSYESDYLSNTPSITLKKDLFGKNTTITASWSGNFDRVSGKFLSSAQSRTTHNVFFGVTQLLSPRMFARLGFSLSESSGMLSEGIRLVPLNGVSLDTCTAVSATCVNEQLPGTRTRRAYIFDINRYFAEGLGGVLERAALKLTLRYYNDDWDIKSYMGEIEYDKHFYDNMLLSLNYRYYTQTKAFFVKDTYLAGDTFKSASPQFENLDTNLVEIKGTYFFDGLEDKSNSIEAKYAFYDESSGVFANVVMLGLRVRY